MSRDKLLPKNNEKSPESALIKRCQQGEQSAYEELFDLYKDKVYSTAVRMLGNELDTQDAAQDIFVKVFGNIHAFRFDSSPSTWIYKIAVNTCLDKLRHDRKFMQVDAIEDLPEYLTALHSNEKTPGAINSIIENEIQKLPEGYKTVFILYAIEGFKHEEIAKILEISPGTSKSQYFAAKSTLRKKLLPYMEAFTHEL
ncbi:hypothetical protein AMJ80_02220 [bacterium SM23_31]|nr:MAG: hypothetical protein AMJ80_02220 [bacterium SM23_31]